MKRQLLIASALIALIATSCSESESDTPQEVNDGYIRVNSSVVGVATKTIVVKDAALTDVVFLRKDDASATAEAAIDFTGVTTFTGSRATGDAGGVTFTTASKYDHNDNTAYLLGYHPVGTTTVSPKTSWTIDGKKDILITDVWNAGKYTAPTTTGMTFRHALSRVEVIIEGQTGISTDALAAVWGNVTKCEISTKPTLELNWKTRAQTATGTATYLAMTKGTTYNDAFVATAIPANGSTAILCGAMVAPQTTETVSIRITTKKGTAADVVKTVSTTITGGLVASKISTITLSFGAADKSITATTTSIVDWSAGGSTSNDVNQ